ncbi:hypothetical protein K8O68_07710 [Salipaludibacillus sp. CUR1]|uniref:hypothetical protein n=1 Tax=Salipaludibacillus sp. CUR1 TaxID=2820003 RepID=UPI001E2B6B8D|nr:hypothetical protein [Salipaludibacillus sp. CUR1]MCE7792305.1 hypothetical protein [Salipaludibacillus sp. CUR1]
MKLFKSEIEKVQEKKSQVNEKIQEEKNKRDKLTNALKLSETELMIDDSASVKKKTDKFSKAIKDLDKEIEKLNKEASEVSSELSELIKQKKQAEIDEACEEYAQEVEISTKATILSKELEKLQDLADKKSGLANPRALKKLAGVKTSERFGQEHAHLQEKAYETNEKAKAKAKKETEKVLKDVKKLLGK